MGEFYFLKINLLHLETNQQIEATFYFRQNTLPIYQLKYYQQFGFCVPYELFQNDFWLTPSPPIKSLLGAPILPFSIPQSPESFDLAIFNENKENFKESFKHYEEGVNVNDAKCIVKMMRIFGEEELANRFHV